MLERFTERARSVVVLAQEEARYFNHNYIGTEHLLLGLLREGEGVAAQALVSLNVTLDEVREQVENIVGYGEEEAGGQVPFTPRSKKILELALREAMQLGHNYIGTEHILLGLVRESEGVAAEILGNLGLSPDRVRREVLQMLGGLSQLTEEDVRRTLFRGRVGALEIGARIGGQPRTLLVELDYDYVMRDTDESWEALDHDELLDLVVGVLEARDFGTVEAGVLETGVRVLERFPAVRDVTVSATRERGITVTRTFRR